MARRRVKQPQEARPEAGQEAVAVRSTGAAAQHTWRNIWLIVRREYTSRVTQRSFRVSSIILLAVIAIAGFVPTIVRVISSRGQAQTQVVVVNEAGAVAAMDESALLSTISTNLNGTSAGSTSPYAVRSEPQSHLGSLEGQAEAGTVGILLVLGRTASGELSFTYYTHSSATNDSSLPRIQALTQQLTFLDTAQRLGLTAAQTGRLLSPPSVTVAYTQQSQSTRPSGEMTARITLTFAGVVLMYLMVGIYESSIAVGVAEEKGSRVMELLLNAATPLQLLAGKILGIGAVCLAQMGALVLVGIVALLVQVPLQAALFGPQEQEFIHYLTAVSVPFYLVFLLYFLLDFFMYASVFAGLGSLARGQDEAQSATLAPGILIGLTWLVVYLGAFRPGTTVVRVLSYVPIFTPTLMLTRLALGTVAWWEIVLTAALMLGVAALGAWFAARMYRYGVLMYGQKPGLGQALRLLRTRP